MASLFTATDPVSTKETTAEGRRCRACGRTMDKGRVTCRGCGNNDGGRRTAVAMSSGSWSATNKCARVGGAAVVEMRQDIPKQERNVGLERAAEAWFAQTQGKTINRRVVAAEQRAEGRADKRIREIALSKIEYM